MTIWSAEIKELETLYTSIKGRFPELEKELGHLIKTDDENVALLYSRRCLEIIVTDLCVCELKRPRKTEPLKGIIDKLNREEKVPSHIITSMQHLNSLSTFGTHPKDFDPEQVKPVLNNLTTIIKWYLKYKDAQTISKQEVEEVKDKIKAPDDSTEHIQKPKKRLILLLSGLALIIVLLIVALIVFDVIGERKPVKVDTDLEKSIAVIPFKNFSTDPDQEYMCMGLTDEIINHLYKIESFDKVVSLSSVMTYQGTDKRLPQIADELQVNYILEGTYKKIGDKVRVTAQLIEPKSDKHLWQNEYDQPYKEIIAIQADIALQIADHVKAFLTVSEKQNIQKIPTTNQEAYQLLQKAKSLSFSYEGFDLILEAIDLDPNYAEAYSMAGTWTLFTGDWVGIVEMSSAKWDALPFFEKALELDQNNAMAHQGMGLINEWGRWDYVKAEKEYLKAIELEPNNLEYFDLIIEFLIKMNRLEDALSYIDTTKPSIFFARIQTLSGNKKESYNRINKYLKLLEEQAYTRVGEFYIWLEEYDSAKLYLESAIQSEIPGMLTPRFQACLALVYYKTKNYQQARTIINQLINKSDTTFAGSPDYFTGWYYSGIGEVDSAFYWLEKAYTTRSPEMPWLKVNPVFKNLKDDDRYQDLYERTGHKAYDEYVAGLKKE